MNGFVTGLVSLIMYEVNDCMFVGSVIASATLG